MVQHTSRAHRRRGLTLLAFLGVTALAVQGASLAYAGPTPAAHKDEVTRFQLFPNKPFLPCLAGKYGSPRVVAEVERGRLNDELELQLKGFKPNLDFDLFTVERSNQAADGSPNPNFHGSFGLAWYQSDIHTNYRGEGEVEIRTILLDQIFGFDADPSINLSPTNTFHVGFWFNNPQDAVRCGFPPGSFTPFNGEHHAGPLAFITRPNAVTGLGPLCIKPNTSTTPATCNP